MLLLALGVVGVTLAGLALVRGSAVQQLPVRAKADYFDRLRADINREAMGR
jgi:hypothetical protein